MVDKREEEENHEQEESAEPDPEERQEVAGASVSASTDTPLQRGIKGYHNVMNSAIKRVYGALFRQGLSALQADSIDGVGISVGSACSGTDIAMVVLSALLAIFASSMGGLEVQVNHTCACEKDEAKRRFLMANFNPLYLFSNVSDLSSRAATNVINGARVYIPYVSLFTAGFSCKSRSSLNCNSPRNVNCVQRGDMSEETTFTFMHIYYYVRRVRPRIVILENVKQILATIDQDSISDAAWIIEQLTAIGYHMSNFVFDCCDFGSIAARKRIYMIVWSLEFPTRMPGRLTLPTPNPLAWCNTFLDNFTIMPFQVSDFIIFDIKKLMGMNSRFTDVKELQDTSSGAKASGLSSSTKWCDEHIDVVRALGLPWPVSIPNASLDENSMMTVKLTDHVPFIFWRACLHDRNAELAYILMVKFPYKKSDVPEFVDTNPSFSRLCSGDAEDSPWRTTVPTITGQSKIVIRYMVGSDVILRPLLGVEVLSVVGWDYSSWKTHGELFPDPLMINLGGNAFSAFAFAPMLMTAVAGQGIIEDCVLEALVSAARGTADCEDGHGDSGSISS